MFDPVHVHAKYEVKPVLLVRFSFPDKWTDMWTGILKFYDSQLNLRLNSIYKTEIELQYFVIPDVDGKCVLTVHTSALMKIISVS